MVIKKTEKTRWYLISLNNIVSLQKKNPSLLDFDKLKSINHNLRLGCYMAKFRVRRGKCVVVEGWQNILPWVSHYSEVWAFASALQTGAFFFLLLRAFADVQIVFWKKNIQGLSPVLIFIFLLISSYIFRKTSLRLPHFFGQSYFPTILISKYEFKKWFT